MTLPSSGEISLSQICVEFGLTQSSAVWPSSFYGKGGAPSSGELKYSDFYGRSASATFDPAPGSYTAYEPMTATFTVTASAAVTWTYTKSAVITCNRSSGASATSITFTLSTTNIFKNGTVSLSASGAGTGSWSCNMTVEGTA